MSEPRTCIHGVALRHGCRDCYPNAREIIPVLPEDDTGEIPMTAAELAATRERVHTMFRSPGWDAPELRALEPED